MADIIKMKRQFYSELDNQAKGVAARIRKRLPATPLLLESIHSLYRCAKTERAFQNERFECAYHNPVTSEFEFLVSRIIYHSYPGMKVYLRRQVSKTVPDVRVERGDKTIAILEMKTKAGWMQPFFSSERERKDLKRLEEGKSDKDPRKQIQSIRDQLLKHTAAFGIGKDRIFMLLPTFTLVHRKRSGRTMKDYLADFERNSTLSRANLIIMSNNLTLDLGVENDQAELMATDRFERFVRGLGQM